MKIMKGFEDFVKEALKGNGVQNDAQDVWVEVDVYLICILDGT